jgi:FKBP-type peptidyl-prolyl cis-trans isomerase
MFVMKKYLLLCLVCGWIVMMNLPQVLAQRLAIDQGTISFQHRNTTNRRILVYNDYAKFHLQIHRSDDSVVYTTYPDRPATRILSRLSHPQSYEKGDRGVLHDFLLKLAVGDSATLEIPAAVYFNAIQKPIPHYLQPHEQLRFVVKVLDVTTRAKLDNLKREANRQQIKADEEQILAYLSKNREGVQYNKTYSGVRYAIYDKGNGRIPKASDIVSIAYTAHLLDGTFVASSELYGPLEFPVDQFFVPDGLSEGIKTLREGGRGSFIIPSTLAHGAKGIPGLVPPNAIMVFDVELLEILRENATIDKSRLLPDAVNIDPRNLGTETNLDKVIVEEVGKSRLVLDKEKMQKYEEDARKRKLDNPGGNRPKQK